jgi:Rhs element Vgr protein
MDGIARNAHYRDQSISDIISSLVSKYPLTVGTVESTDGTVGFITQYRETDYDYIMRLAGSSGKFAYYDGREFNFMSASASDSVALNWRQNLGVFRLGLGTAPMEFKADVYNYEQKKVYSQDSKSISQQASLSEISNVSPDASRKIFKDSSFSTSGKVNDAQALDRRLENERGRAMGSMVRCMGESIVPAVGIGKSLEVSGMQSLDGQYWVKGVRHIYNESGKYHNLFICTPLDIAYPDRKSAENDLQVEERPITAVTSSQAVKEIKERPVRGMQLARVINIEDPDQMGRVKISYPWLDSEETAWVRIAVPHAGKDRGWFTLPELDDEVLVGFENGDPDYPVIIGCLYNKENLPMSEAYAPDNNVKMFMTRSGNKLVFNDEDGSEQIVISQKDGKNQIVLDLSGPSVSISTEGDISVTGSNLNVEADQGITLKASSDIKIEGANIDIKANGNIKSEAAANHDIKGSAQVNVKGGMINLN